MDKLSSRDVKHLFIWNIFSCLSLRSRSICDVCLELPSLHVFEHNLGNSLSRYLRIKNDKCSSMRFRPYEATKYCNKSRTMKGALTSNESSTTPAVQLVFGLWLSFYKTWNLSGTKRSESAFYTKGQWSFLKGNVRDSFDFVPRLIKSEESFFVSNLLLTDYSQETQIDAHMVSRNWSINL